MCWARACLLQVESDSAVLLSSEPVSEEVPFLLVSLEESELGGTSDEFLERLDPFEPLGLLPRRCVFASCRPRSCATIDAVESSEENISKSQLDMR